MNPKWKRRDFLRHTAMAGLLAPVAQYWPDLAEAQDLLDKRNLVLVFLPNGKAQGNPYLTRSGSSFQFDFGFEPYNRFRDDVIAFEQYAFGDFVRPTGHGGPGYYSGPHWWHYAAAMAMFSAEAPTTAGGRAPTIDQIVAFDYLDRGIIRNPLRKSLHVKIAGSSLMQPSVFYQTPADYQLGRTYSNALTPVSHIQDPRAGFALMFGDLAEMSGGSMMDLWNHGRSILDVPAAELSALRSTLPSDGRAIVDEQLMNLRELERSFSDMGNEPIIGEPPPEPASIALSPDNHERVFSQWVQIIDAALRLDRTRIVTIQFGGAASRFEIPTLRARFVDGSAGAGGTDHHAYTHHAPAGVPQFMNWFAERNAELLDALKGTGGGANLLPSSVVMVGCEFGRNHNPIDVPVLLFGQGGGYFRTGQVVTYGNDLGHFHKHTGTLLSVCHAMGVNRLEAVGGRQRPEFQQGPVPELRA